MKFRLSIIVLLLFSFPVFAQPGQPVNIARTVQLPSKELNETRTINIYLPDGYDPKDSAGYEVIYLPDGGVEEDFFHVAGVVRFNNQPWVNRFPKSIVVGIENTNRRRDFTFQVPNLDFVAKMGFKKEQFPAYGGSGKYIAFLQEELQPFIDSSFRTNRQRTIIGESLAGLLATEILLKHIDLFDTYIIITPSLWWGGESLLKSAPTLLPADHKRKVKVYVGACNKEEDKVMYEDAMALSDLLKKRSGTWLYHVYDYLPDEYHATVMHLAVYNAFKLLYPVVKSR